MLVLIKVRCCLHLGILLTLFDKLLIASVHQNLLLLVEQLINVRVFHLVIQISKHIISLINYLLPHHLSLLNNWPQIVLLDYHVVFHEEATSLIILYKPILVVYRCAATKRILYSRMVLIRRGAPVESRDDRDLQLLVPALGLREGQVRGRRVASILLGGRACLMA